MPAYVEASARVRAALHRDRAMISSLRNWAESRPSDSDRAARSAPAACRDAAGRPRRGVIATPRSPEGDPGPHGAAAGPARLRRR